MHDKSNKGITTQVQLYMIYHTLFMNHICYPKFLLIIVTYLSAYNDKSSKGLKNSSRSDSIVLPILTFLLMTVLTPSAVFPTALMMYTRLFSSLRGTLGKVTVPLEPVVMVMHAYVCVCVCVHQLLLHVWYNNYYVSLALTLGHSHDHVTHMQILKMWEWPRVG